MSPSPSPVRVLVIRAGALGDTVCASSIIEPLRCEFGQDVHIEWVAKAGMGDLFAADPRIANVHELRNRRLSLPFNRGKAAIVRASRRRPFDYVINLELGPLFNDLVRAVSARHRIGMPYHYFAEPPEAHAVENLKLIYKSFLGQAAMRLAAPGLQGFDPERVISRFNLPESYVVLVPSNSHFKKAHPLNHRAWPLEHWRSLIDLLSDKGYASVLIGAASDSAIVDEIGPLPTNCINLVGKTRYSEVITLISAASHVIATDTGPAHIAAATNTPVTVLIGPTNPRRTGPFETADNKVITLSAGLPCSPCYHTPALRNCHYNRCMTQIRPLDVVNAI